MAFTPSSYLTQNTEVILRDQQHAARMFVDDQFRLAPKFKFLFHVSFGINAAALQNINIIQRHTNEINMLVKSCDLPNFTIQTETVNQYNRKKNVQTTHKYNPVSIIFHDDNMGLINQLWENYYNYYYADPSSAQDAGAYARNATKNFSYIKNTYGLNNGSQLPFFKYIKMTQLARHEYSEYTLHNPMITQWNHNKVSYYEGSTHEKTMQIAYEAVSYKTGNVEAGKPQGFGLEHYDKTPSPLTGKEFTTASPSFASANQINTSDYINVVSTSINTYENTKSLQIYGVNNIISSINTGTASVSGIGNITFPIYQTTNTQTVATLVNL
jgi:hypothetical protein